MFNLCAMFFNSSFTVSIKARFLNRILSAMLIRGLYFIFYFGNQLNSIHKKVFKQYLSDIYLVNTQLLFYVLQKSPLFQRFPVIYVSGVNMKWRISPLSLIIRWSLNPKNHPIEQFSCLTNPQRSYESICIGYDRHVTVWNL